MTVSYRAETAEQGLLIGSRTCECGAPLPEYPGVGRPRKLCDACYPTRAPARKAHEVPAGLSGQSVTPTARHSDPESSHAAARSLRLSADNDRGLALLALVDHGAMHDFELAEKVGKKQTSVGVRRKELVHLGLAERAPCNPRPNADGSMCIVWRVTPEGVLKARELRGTDG